MKRTVFQRLLTVGLILAVPRVVLLVAGGALRLLPLLGLAGLVLPVLPVLLLLVLRVLLVLVLVLLVLGHDVDGIAIGGGQCVVAQRGPRRAPQHQWRIKRDAGKGIGGHRHRPGR